MTTGDLPIVRNEDERLLRDFCAARDRGDADGMRHCWGALVENNVDRVMSITASTGPRELTREEREDAAQAAFIKLWKNMIHTFRGTSTSAFYAALVQCVKFALLGEHRSGAIRISRTRSVDRVGGDGEPEGYDHWTAEESEACFERSLQKREAEDFVAWALPRMRSADQRVVIERSLDGVPVPDIARELGTTPGNVHALRSRGLKDLRKLFNQYEDHDA